MVGSELADGLGDGLVAVAYEALDLGSCAGTAGMGEVRRELDWAGMPMVEDDDDGFDCFEAGVIALVMGERRW